MTLIHLDVCRAPAIDRGHAFLQLEPATANVLQKWPEIHVRLNNALRFACMISGDHQDTFRCALIRATLTELVSVEDVQRFLISEKRWMEPSVKLDSSRHPLLCIARELRNVEVHVSSSTIAQERRNLLWGRPDAPDEALDVNCAVQWIDNLDLNAFKKLKYFSRYDESAFDAALKWFNLAQRDWGIVELLYRAISIYGNELAAHQ
jgi:hypothetical protein